MKISLNSIKKLTEIKVSVEELEKLIASKIGNVEEIEHIGKKYEGIVVADIVAKENHPESDVLGVYKLKIDSNKIVQVVAGDKSMQIGDKVAYFPPGVKVPYNAHPEKYDGTVREVTLRGVTSFGMMASAKELEISNDHEKVLRLDTSCVAGTSFIEAYDLDDYIFDLENKALTNRPECFGLIGIAREIAGIQWLNYKTPTWFDYSTQDWKKDFPGVNKVLENPIKLQVKNEAGELCPRYMGVVMDNVEIKDSPIWLQIELMKSGIRPINNVVDITNYIMILTGQPLHAFDMDKIIDKDASKIESDQEVNILVRTAKPGETITIIDATTKELDDKIVVITDGVSPVAIAGVMGGLSSEIDNNTKRVVIECANFDMYNIRKTANKIGVNSDAVARYSRNQDPQQCETVMYKTIEMMTDIANANQISQIVDVYTKKRYPKEISVSISDLKTKTGLEIQDNQIINILSNVEIQSSLNGDTLLVKAPSYRQDLNIPEDIYEEVSRLFGFDKIKLNLPDRSLKPSPANKILDFQSEIRKIVSGIGGYEVMTYNFTSLNLLEICGIDKEKAYHLRNPLSPELSYMRVNLLPSLLEKVPQNIANGHDEFLLFEINKCHIKGVLNEEKLPYEFRHITGVFSMSDKTSKLKRDGSSFYQAKYVVDYIINSLKIKNIQYLKIENISKIPENISILKDSFEIGERAIITTEIGGEKIIIGMLGSVSNSVKDSLGLPEYTCGFELDIEKLFSVLNKEKLVVNVSKYPKVSQDLCFLADKDVQYTDIEGVIRKSVEDAQLILETIPVDIYNNKENPGKRQVTIRVVIQSKEKALKEKDIEYWRDIIVKNVEEATGARIK